jgi:hypothetical protein
VKAWIISPFNKGAQALSNMIRDYIAQLGYIGNPIADERINMELIKRQIGMNTSASIRLVSDTYVAMEFLCIFKIIDTLFSIEEDYIILPVLLEADGITCLIFGDVNIKSLEQKVNGPLETFSKHLFDGHMVVEVTQLKSLI